MAKVERFHLMANLDLLDRKKSSDPLEYIFGLSKEPEEEGDEEQHTENCITPFRPSWGQVREGE